MFEKEPVSGFKTVKRLHVWFVLLLITAIACSVKKEEAVTVVPGTLPVPTSYLLPGKQKLSEYGFFTGELRRLEPAPRVFPYEVNAALFSDYAYKKRFIYLPPGTAATYHPTDVLEFPEGTVLIKNFYYPADFRKPNENLRILETRLLVSDSGRWKALPYVWNDEQTEAFLMVAGHTTHVQWIHNNGVLRELDYAVPNINQCKGCHLRGDKIAPIGLLARQLNKIMNGRNQLAWLAAQGVVKGIPPLDHMPYMPDYDDPSAPLDARARAWLEINCAHCHRPDGPAKTSGLHLTWQASRPFELGIGKPPVAAGRGSGGLAYDIVPGYPEKSILYYRITSTDPGIMMPELGKKLVHEEGVALIRQWITSLK